MNAITFKYKDSDQFDDENIKHQIEAISKSIADVLRGNSFSCEGPEDGQSEVPTYLIGCEFAKGEAILTVGSEPANPASIFIIIKEHMPLFASLRAKSSLNELGRLKETIIAFLESEGHIDAVKEESAYNVLLRMNQPKSE
jgi:hypothetical protein